MTNNLFEKNEEKPYGGFAPSLLVLLRVKNTGEALGDNSGPYRAYSFREDSLRVHEYVGNDDFIK